VKWIIAVVAVLVAIAIGVIATWFFTRDDGDAASSASSATPVMIRWSPVVLS
jgi:flagellar basal body-associated protein FliL